MRYRLKAGSAAAAAFVLVAVTPLGAGASFPGDNGRIIFNRSDSRGRNAQTSLVSVNPDGSDETRINGRSRSSFGARWAPDGSRFIYTRWETLDFEKADLFLLDADGSNRTRVTDTIEPEVKPSFGPDGNQAVYSRCDPQCDLFTIDLTTGTETRLTDSRAEEFSPDWSVDDLIVFIRFARSGGDAEIFTIHPDGTTTTRLTDNRRDDMFPSWSPDGMRIVYANRHRLFTMDADGSGRERVTNTKVDEIEARYSPNGLFFVVSRSRPGQGSDLFRMRTDGSRLRQLTDTPNKSESNADWQPLP